MQASLGLSCFLLVALLATGPSDNGMPAGRGMLVEATYRSRWEDAKLVTTIVRPVRGGVVRYVETRYVDPGGAMVVEITMQGRGGGRTTVYTRVD